MMKYYILFLPLILTGCFGFKHVTSRVVAPANPPPVTAKTFVDIDRNQDGMISQTEYDIVTPKPEAIDISTPVNIFTWVIVTMLLICILCIVIPKATRLGKQYLKDRKSRTADKKKSTVLNG